LIEMSPLTVTIALFGSILVALASGLPIVFVLGSVAVIFSFLLWGPNSMIVIASKTWALSINFVLIAIPMFVLMAHILERSGVADALYAAMHKWMGPLRGGLGMGTVLICTIFAAMSGISATAAVTMGLIAIPRMLERGYDKKIAIGCVGAGGALGVLIPPSVLMILLSLFTNLSVGKLFMGGVFPGLVLSGLFCLYIGVRCFLNPSLGPALPPEERGDWREKMVSARAVILPIMIVLMVLGSIFAGIATPSEASAMGAAGAVISAAVYRRLNWKMFREASLSTMKVTGMIFWIVFAAGAFAQVYNAIGGPKFISELMAVMPGGRWGALIFTQVVLLILGCFIDPSSIIMITVPVFFPAIVDLGFNPLWYGIVFVVNMEMSYITPPFGANLFYLKSVLPSYLTMGDVYRSIVPFLILQMIGLVIVMLFPALATWLPSMMLGG